MRKLLRSCHGSAFIIAVCCAACGGGDSRPQADTGASPVDASAAPDAAMPADAPTAAPDVLSPPDADPCPTCQAPVVSESAASPARVRATGGATLLAVRVTDADGDLATVSVDLTQVGGGAAQDMLPAGGDLFTFALTTSGAVTGDLFLPVTATDATLRSSMAGIALEVQPTNPAWRLLRGSPNVDGGVALHDAATGRVLFYVSPHVWTWSISDGWRRLEPGGPRPSTRYMPALAVDAAANRLVLFGGWDYDTGFEANDLWALSLTPGSEAWMELTAAAPVPAARDSAGVVIDEAAGRMLVYGGYGDFDPALDDLWSLELTPGAEAWTELTPAGMPPAGTYGSGFAYDGANGRAILYGGQDDLDATSSQLWSLDLTPGAETWTEIPVAGPARVLMGFHADPLRSRIVMFGGYDAWTTMVDVWSLSTTPGAETWTPVLPSGSGPSDANWVQPASALVGDRLWTYVFNPEPLGGTDVFQLDVTTPGSETWSAWDEPYPQSRVGALMVVDGTGDRLVLHGGVDWWSYSIRGDTHWAYDLAGGSEWTEIALDYPTGAYYVDFPSWGFSPSRQEMIFSGGSWGGLVIGLPITPGAETFRSIASEIAGSVAAAVDDANDRLITIGCDFPCTDPVWATDLATSAQAAIVASGTLPPSPFAPRATLYDAANQRIIAFEDPTALYAMDLTPGSEAWSLVTPVGTLPPPLLDAPGVQAGAPGVTRYYTWGADEFLWRLDLSAGAEAWSQLGVDGDGPTLRRQVGAAHDATRNRILVFGGQPGPNNDLWTIAYLED